MPVNSFENYPMSWRPAIDRSSRSLYKSLAQKLEEDITCGALKPGTKLPPQRELADYLDINVSTVSKAFRLCELKGLLSATVGSGTFVAYDVMTSGRMLSESAERLIDLGPTVPEPSGNVFLRRMLSEITDDEHLGDLFSYPRPETTAWQSEAAARLLAHCGCHTSPQQVPDGLRRAERHHGGAGRRFSPGRQDRRGRPYLSGYQVGGGHVRLAARPHSGG